MFTRGITAVDGPRGQRVEPMSIRLVSFDVWGTLVTRPAQLPELLVNYLSGLSGRDRTEVRALIRQAGQEFDDTAIRTGEDRSSRAKLNSLKAMVGLSELPIEALEREIWSHLELAPPVLIEPESCIDVWNRLRERNIGITIASNSGFIDAQMMRHVLHQLGLLSDDERITCVFSDELGIAKPNPDFFAKVVGAHSPSEALHIGDNLAADVVGARNHGMRALWYRFAAAKLDPGSAISSISQLFEHLNS